MLLIGVIPAMHVDLPAVARASPRIPILIRTVCPAETRGIVLDYFCHLKVIMTHCRIPTKPILAELIGFGPALLLFLLAALSSLHTPGIYMDSVNPDYVVVRVLGDSRPIAIWALPGTVLFGKFPVIGQIYHGALPFWLGLPSYSIFGTGVVGIRITNAMFGTLVLASFYAVSRAFGIRRWLSAAVTAALAVDAGFCFSFKSQFYILLLPLTFLLSGIALAEFRRKSPTTLVSIVSGLAVGIAVYGYFIHLFLALGCALHAWLRWSNRADRLHLFGCWTAGLLIGASPYALGYALILKATGGWVEFVSFLRANLNALDVTVSQTSAMDRVVYFGQMLAQTTLDVGPGQMLLARPPTILYPTLKQLTLLGIPAVGIAAAIYLRSTRVQIGLVASFIAGMALLFAVFGTRVWLTHAIVLLPILYLGLAVTLQMLPRTRLASVCVGVCCLGLIVCNIVDRAAFSSELDRTGGVNLSSNSYETFAQDMMDDSRPLHVFFPDWGLFMPFAMMTHGSVPYTPDFRPELARQTLCSGRDAVVALVAGNAPDRVKSWTEQVDIRPPLTKTYFRKDGVASLTVLRWAADSRHAVRCSVAQ